MNQFVSPLLMAMNHFICSQKMYAAVSRLRLKKFIFVEFKPYNTHLRLKKLKFNT